MGIFKGKEIFTIKPWLTGYKQNVEQLKKILGLSSDNMLPAIEEGDEGKVVGVSSGKYALVEGGGGSSDFSTAEVTIVNNSLGIFELMPTTLEMDTKLLGFRWTVNGVDSQQTYGYNSNTETTEKFYIYDGYYMFGYNLTIADTASYTVTGSAELTVVDNVPIVKITGDCTITMQ